MWGVAVQWVQSVKDAKRSGDRSPSNVNVLTTTGLCSGNQFYVMGVFSHTHTPHNVGPDHSHTDGVIPGRGCQEVHITGSRCHIQGMYLRPPEWESPPTRARQPLLTLRGALPRGSSEAAAKPEQACCTGRCFRMSCKRGPCQSRQPQLKARPAPVFFGVQNVPREG